MADFYENKHVTEEEVILVGVALGRNVGDG